MSEVSLGMLSSAVTDLAGRVEALEAQVAGEGSGASTDLERRLRAVEDLLARIRPTVDNLARTKTASQAQILQRQPWNKLNAEQAEKRWTELREWVNWLVVRDDIGTKEIPDCWYLHGGLVDELEALRWSWVETNRPESKMTDPMVWRESLQRARIRWPSFNANGCTTTHTETRSRALDNSPDWCNFLAEELADRLVNRPAPVSAHLASD